MVLECIVGQNTDQILSVVDLQSYQTIRIEVIPRYVQIRIDGRFVEHRDVCVPLVFARVNDDAVVFVTDDHCRVYSYV